MKRGLLGLAIMLAFYCANAQTFNPTNSISAPGAANTFVGGYTFAYGTSGSPWNGAFMSFGGGSNNYDCQISTSYGNPGHISFRTHNGDNGVWNGWFEILHSGNMNRADVDFTARTINCANVYNGGNLWSKQITVALSNPWPDYVFKAGYNLLPLTDLKAYIGKNNHLPDVPSEQEIAKDGLNLGEMNTKLLKKVEELTLYLLQQKEETDKQLRVQEQEIEELKRLLKK